MNGQYTFFANVYDPSNNNFIYDRFPLQFLPIVHNIVIQTDKDIYKPDDLIRFRVFCFDGDSRPVVTRTKARISILDPMGFELKVFPNVSLEKGRYKDEVQLSSFVMSGLWIIRVNTESRVFEKEIDVQVYNLPLCTASIIVPQKVAITDKQ